MVDAERFPFAAAAFSLPEEGPARDFFARQVANGRHGPSDLGRLLENLQRRFGGR
ncbi:MAG: hypothetical protein ACK5SX_08195 [Sandaracinobacter sp.]